MKLWNDFTNGIIKENPTLRLVLGTCPTLAVTTAVFNGIGMGIAATAVLIGSNLIISMINKIVPNEVRIPIYVVVIATFVTAVQMLIKRTYSPALDSALGIFIPLIVVNCIILARAESFASKSAIKFNNGRFRNENWFYISTINYELNKGDFGAGTFLGRPIFGAGFEPALILILPPGGFLIFGLTIALVNKLTEKKLREGTRI